MYYNNDAGQNQLMVCRETSVGVFDWQAAGASFWTQSGSNLYPNDVNWNVGIGTNTPTVKLDVNGGIRASFSDPDVGGTVAIANPAKVVAGTAQTWRIYNMSGIYGNSLQFWAYDTLGCVVGGLCAPRLILKDNGGIVLPPRATDPPAPQEGELWVR